MLKAFAAELLKKKKKNIISTPTPPTGLVITHTQTFARVVMCLDFFMCGERAEMFKEHLAMLYLLI